MAAEKRDYYTWFGDEVVDCPHCGAENRIGEGLFCKKCGREILNFCTDPECENSVISEMGIDADAHYCSLCGALSSFSKLGYFEEESLLPQ